MKYFTIYNADKFNYYQIPKILILGEKYRKLSNNARIIYSILLNRTQLSNENRYKYADENGRLFIIYTQDEMAKLLGMSPKTVRSSYEMLEKHGLLERVEIQTTFKKVHKLYLLQPDDTDKKEEDKPPADPYGEEEFADSLGKNYLSQQQNLTPIKHNINKHKYSKRIEAKASMASPKEEDDMKAKQVGLFNDVSVKKYEKRITWKNVVELFLEEHNAKMRKPIERDSDKKALNNHLPSFFRNRGIEQEQAYELMPHFIQYFKSHDEDTKNDEWVKPIWFHPEKGIKAHFKLEKALEFALNKQNEFKQEQSPVNELEIPDDPELDDLFE